MARIASVAVAAAISLPAATAEGPVLTRPDGGVTEWSEWLGEHGRTAVVLWASWSPTSGAVLAELEPLAAACRELEIALVLVAVQEPLEDSRRSLERRKVAWLHDRHGGLLKSYRLIRVPTLVVVEADGRLAAELDVSAQALRRWASR